MPDSNGSSPLRLVLATLRHSERGYLVAVVLLHFAESVGVVATVHSFSSDARTAGVVGTATLAMLFGARRYIGALLARRVRMTLIDRTMSAVLSTETTRGSLLRDQEATVAVFEGLYFAERVVVEVLPGAAAALLASAVLGAAFVYAVPGRVVLTAAAAVMAAVGATFLSRLVTARNAAATEVASRRAYEGIVAGVNGRIDLIANGRDAEFLRSLNADVLRWCDLALRADRVSALAGRAPIIAAALAVAGVVALGSELRSEIVTTDLARYAVYASAVPPFLALARHAMDLARNVVKLRPLADLLTADRLPAGGPDGAPLPALPADVEWRDVDARYGPERDPALESVSVSWPAGQVLLVTGPNGSGKSTMLRLLLGLLASSSGGVTVGGVDVLTLDLHAWRKRAAYLSQRPYIQDRASVRETIAVMAPDADDQTMRLALERLDVWVELARAAPADPLSAAMGTLSVGQRQRVLLARVLAQDASIIVLDEPDANLDAAGVARVAEIVCELGRDRMVAVAAHTKELTAKGHVLVRLDGGRRVRADDSHVTQAAGRRDAPA